MAARVDVDRPGRRGDERADDADAEATAAADATAGRRVRPCWRRGEHPRRRRQGPAVPRRRICE